VWGRERKNKAKNKQQQNKQTTKINGSGGIIKDMITGYLQKFSMHNLNFSGSLAHVNEISFPLSAGYFKGYFFRLSFAGRCVDLGFRSATLIPKEKKIQNG